MLSSPATTSHEVFKTQRNNKKKDDNSRRFSDEQIKSLESVFKMENKLEPKKKLEMARELGLQPRQVAIWFQNRRARWKSKQVEQDYTNLKADYDNLSNRFESLKKEKHDLLHQLSNLCSQLKEPDHEGSKDLESGSEDGEMNGNSSGPLADEEDDPSQKEKVENMNMTMDLSHEKVCNFDMGGLFDQSCSNWWDIWS